MKIASLVLFASVVLSTSAMASEQGRHVAKMLRSGSSAPAVPTGYQVPGPAAYVLRNGEVVRITDCEGARRAHRPEIELACGRVPGGTGVESYGQQ